MALVSKGAETQKERVADALAWLAYDATNKAVIVDKLPADLDVEQLPVAC